MCGSCAKKRRPCIYTPVKLADRVPNGRHVLAFPVDDTYDHDTTEIGILDPVLGLGDKLLEVRNVYPAEHGQGTFHTMDLSAKCLLKRASTSPKIEPCSPKLAILCPQSSARERWSSIFGYEALSLNPLGDYVKTAILYAPENRALDLACQYTLNSMFAFQRRDDASLMRAHKTGAKALAALKAAVSSSLSNDDMRNVTIAMLLHFAAEVSRVVVDPLTGIHADRMKALYQIGVVQLRAAYARGSLYASTLSSSARFEDSLSRDCWFTLHGRGMVQSIENTLGHRIDGALGI